MPGLGVSDDELIRALDKLGETLTERGNAAGAAEVRGVAVGLWEAVREHRVAVMDANRIAARLRAHDPSPVAKTRSLHLAQVTMRHKVALLKEARERANRRLNMGDFASSEIGARKGPS